MKVRYIGPLSQVEYGGFGRFNKGEEIKVDPKKGYLLLQLGFEEIIDKPAKVKPAKVKPAKVSDTVGGVYLDGEPDIDETEDSALESENIESEIKEIEEE